METEDLTMSSHTILEQYIRDAQETNFPLIITIKVSEDNIVYLTTAPEDVRYNNIVYRSDAMPIKSTVVSATGILAERERFSISFVDSDRSIQQYFESIVNDIDIALGVLVLNLDSIPIGSIQLSSGRLSQVTHGVAQGGESGKAEAITIISVIGLFPKLDDFSFARTTKQSQSRFDLLRNDPLRRDNIFDYVNIPIDRRWGAQ